MKLYYMAPPPRRLSPDTAVLSSTGQPAIPAGMIAWFLTLLIVCYAPVLKLLVIDWEQNEDMGHGFFVPVIAAYIVWQKRQRIFSVPAMPNYLGLLVVAAAGLQLYVATLGAELFLARTAFIFSLAGAVLFLGGTQRAKLVAFPIMLLVFMVPLPAIIYNQITFPLQLLASRVAETALSAIGIPVLREGNVLELAPKELTPPLRGE